MKRESQSEYPRVRKFKPLLFWYKCRFCNQEFRRENGYEIIDYPIINGIYSTTYCCESCCENENYVRQRIIDQKVKLRDRVLSSRSTIFKK